MKKIIVLLLTLFIPFIVYAETCDNDKVTLELIGDGNQTGFVSEKSDPAINGKNINVDLKMTKQGDAMEYKISVKNDSNADYEIDKNSFNIDSEYINYTLSFDDNSTIVTAGTSKVATLRVEYANPVPADVLLAGPVTDNKTITVNLSSGKDIDNPKTGVQSLLLAFVLTLSVSSVALLILNKKGYATLILIGGIAIIIPVTVNAVCKCELNLSSKVEIVKNPEFCYYYSLEDVKETRYYEYEEGMTWVDYVDSVYFDLDTWSGLIDINNEMVRSYNFPNTFVYLDNTEEALDYEYSATVNHVVPEGVIKSSDAGCYATIFN